MKPRKIAILLPTLSVGGAEKLVLEELLFLKNDPRFVFEVHVVFEGGPFNELLINNGITTIVWNAPHKSLHTIITYIKIIRYLRSNCFDVLHNHLSDHIGPWVGRLSNLKTMATVHNDVTYTFWERTALKQSDIVFACGSRVVENIKRFLPGSKVRLLNNAIMLPDVSHMEINELWEKIGLKTPPAENQFVLSMGRLTEQKGYDVLVDAFEKVVQSVPDALLLIAGDGPDKKELQLRITSKGLGRNVFLLGIIMNAGDLLSYCNVYVNSSRWEGLPMTLLEAMAHKRPIIATNVGGNSEVIHDRETGLLVIPERPELLSAAIIELLNDKQLCAKLSSNAFSLYKQAYTIDSHCTQLAEEYLSV